MVCTLYEEFDTVAIGLSTTFLFDGQGVYDVQDYGPSGQYDTPAFLSLDSDTQVSMWWGKAMMWVIFYGNTNYFVTNLDSALYSFHVCLFCITTYNGSDNSLRSGCGLWYSQLSASYGEF